MRSAPAVVPDDRVYSSKQRPSLPMNRDTLSGQMFRSGSSLVVTACAYRLWHGSGPHEITAGEAEGLNTLILLIGSIYAVIFAFVIFVIWGQFTDVENFMMRECNSLNELLRFSGLSIRKAAVASGARSRPTSNMW